MKLPPRLRRWLFRIARVALIVYLGLAIVISALQDSLIFPGRTTQGQRQAVIRPSTDRSYELVDLKTASGDRTVALFGQALDRDGNLLADAKAQPTILFFYGNGMCLADCFTIFRDLRRLGVNVMIVEYVGYGMSTGKPSEKTFYETADASWDQLQSRADIDPSKIIIAGWSLGGAVAIDSVVRRPVIGLAIFSAFTSMHDMARGLLPWLPTSMLLRHHFPSIGNIAKVTCPILIAHGSRDQIVPSEMSIRLATAATASPRVLQVSVDSDHGDLFDKDDAIYGPLRQFIDSLR